MAAADAAPNHHRADPLKQPDYPLNLSRFDLREIHMERRRGRIPSVLLVCAALAVLPNAAAPLFQSSAHSKARQSSAHTRARQSSARRATDAPPFNPNYVVASAFSPSNFVVKQSLQNYFSIIAAAKVDGKRSFKVNFFEYDANNQKVSIAEASIPVSRGAIAGSCRIPKVVLSKSRQVHAEVWIESSARALQPETLFVFDSIDYARRIAVFRGRPFRFGPRGTAGQDIPAFGYPANPIVTASLNSTLTVQMGGVTDTDRPLTVTFSPAPPGPTAQPPIPAPAPVVKAGSMVACIDIPKNFLAANTSYIMTVKSSTGSNQFPVTTK
jgi:hypothetical protein